MIGGDVTTEFLRDVLGEVFLTLDAAAAEHGDCEHILEGLDERIDAFSPHRDADATMQPGSEQDPDGEDDDDGFHSCCSSDDGGRDDDDDDDLMSPFTRDAPAGPPLRGGEASGTAAPALGSRSGNES